MVDKFDLTATELILLQSEQRSRSKSLGVAYLMLFGGHLGLHRFYMHRKVSGGFQLALTLLSGLFYILMAIAGGVNSEAGSAVFLVLFLLTIVPLTVWIIVDACLMPGMVRRMNVGIEDRIVQEIYTLRSRKQDFRAGSIAAPNQE